MDTFETGEWSKFMDNNNSSFPIMKLTGQPISIELYDILNRLKNNEYVDIDEIMNTKEIQLAESCCSHQIPTINLSNREDLRLNAFNKIMEHGSVSFVNGIKQKDADGNTIYKDPIKYEKRLDIVIGLPASGKSSAIVDKISHEYNSMLIDGDTVKKQFIEYNNGWGATAVHKEAQLIEELVFRECIYQGRNIVLPKVGSNSKKIEKKFIEVAKNNGYTVNIHFCDLPREKALGRMILRFIEEGRYITPTLINKYSNEFEGNLIEKTYQNLKENNLVDGVSRWNNDIQKDEEVILLEDSGINSNYILNARKDVDYYVRRNELIKQFEQRSTDELCITGDNRADRRSSLSGISGTQFTQRQIEGNEFRGESNVHAERFKQTHVSNRLIIRISASQDSKDLGYASLSFGNKIQFNHIKLLPNNDGSININYPTHTENGKKVYIFSPITKKAKEDIEKAILTAYSSPDKEYVIDLDSINMNVMVDGDIKIYLNNSMKLIGVKVSTSKQGNPYLSMPKILYNHDNEKKFIEVAKPLSKESYSEILNAWTSKKNITKDTHPDYLSKLKLFKSNNIYQDVPEPDINIDK